MKNEKSYELDECINFNIYDWFKKCRFKKKFYYESKLCESLRTKIDGIRVRP